ncbi:MAG: TraB/GumN family protein, partial [Pseudomonadota bacterium]|nr:TraB/GumN family protein [Pseudomonadota bacterium]
DETLDAWSTGDVARLHRALDATFTGAPVLRDALLTQRNRRWADLLAQRLARPGTTLVAVGAGHLVGAPSVLSLLQARGFTLERLE